MTTIEALQPDLKRIERLALLAASVGLGVCVLAALGLPYRFYPAYLVAFLFWVGIGVGCLAITMLHLLVGGTWGVPIRRPLESGAMTLLPLAILFLPLLLGMPKLYEWARPEVVAHDHVLQEKAPYLNTTGFAVRGLVYFAIWGVMAVLLNRLSNRQDKTENEGPTRWMKRIAGPGLALYVLTVTFSSVDWAMSLEPHWYSTIYGALFLVGHGLSTFALMIAVAFWLSRFEGMQAVATKSRFQDLGNLLLAFVMLWAYMSFSQYLIIWSGNTHEEIPWYIRRTTGGWGWIAVALILFHFFLPFGFLLFRDVKRGGRLLLVTALLVVFMHLVDIVWLVLPAVPNANRFLEFPILAAAFVGIGGVSTWVFARGLMNRPLVPLHDPATLAAASGHAHSDEEADV